MALVLDLQSELAIFKFLEEDLRSISFANEAERLQLAEIMEASAPPKFKGIKQEQPLTDQEIALQLAASENHLALDRAYAELLQSEDASFAISMQEAQRLAAAEQKTRIDNEFAKRLQATLDADEAGNQIVQNNCIDAESALGMEAIDEIHASNPNSKGKGKEKGKAGGLEVAMIRKVQSTSLNDTSEKTTEHVLTHYGGANRQFLHAPSFWSSAALPSKLDPDGQGHAKDTHVVFPIRCPECPADKWPQGIPDTVATKVLAKDVMELWPPPSLLSEQVVLGLGREMATMQQVQANWDMLWEDDNQLLDEDQRGAQPQPIVRAAAPRAPALLALGANALAPQLPAPRAPVYVPPAPAPRATAPVAAPGYQYLHTYAPPTLPPAPAPAPAYAPPAPAPAPPAPALAIAPEYPFLHRPASLKNVFTAQMLRTNSCGYCDRAHDDVQGLQAHLSNVQRHPVFSCCGKFFRQQQHYEQHASTGGGYHTDTYVREENA
ncbi:hypothetical protein HWV62_26402 [Athelia sp. TMB]|nr:hypothetical protein HWV62_41922 [Athelia sp. TMB]KAF7986611.1 hypothetical protein HWV62_26402 [Athelia sp. TMB]